MSPACRCFQRGRGSGSAISAARGLRSFRGPHTSRTIFRGRARGVQRTQPSRAARRCWNNRCLRRFDNRARAAPAPFHFRWSGGENGGGARIARALAGKTIFHALDEPFRRAIDPIGGWADIPGPRASPSKGRRHRRLDYRPQCAGNPRADRQGLHHFTAGHVWTEGPAGRNHRASRRATLLLSGEDFRM